MNKLTTLYKNLDYKNKQLTNSLRTLLDDIGESVIQVGDYGNIPANKAFWTRIKRNYG